MGSGNTIGLVVHVDCPVSLEDMLLHFRMGTWGKANPDAPEENTFTELSKVQDFMETQNGCPIDIEEFNIQLRDCLLVLQKTENRSIATCWISLFESLSEHYRDFSSGGTAVPEEMYFSVYSSEFQNENEPGYWALYFPEDNRGWVYDLELRSLSPEDILINPQPQSGDPDQE